MSHSKELLASEMKVLSISTQCDLNVCCFELFGYHLTLQNAKQPIANNNNSNSNSVALNESEIIQNLKTLIGREILRTSSR
jgi:hypothetical protein